MASAAVSSYRDRTAEFLSLSQTLKKIEGIPSVHSRAPEHSSSRSEFTKKASIIGSKIHDANRRIIQLSQLAKKSSMFDNPTVEIDRLSGSITNDIATLREAVRDLATLGKIEIANGSYSEDETNHANAVCTDLNNRLMAATKSLQDVLTTRSENIKAHETRKQIFSVNAKRDKPFQNQTRPVTEPPPWSNPSNVVGSVQPNQVPSSGVQAGSQLRRRLPTETSPSSSMEMSMLQEQVVPEHDNYSRSQATALHNIESTISEVSGIFNHLVSVVAQQEELAIRIDDNMDQSLANVEGAHSSLLKYLTRISSNRSLLIKLFLVLIFFLVVFIFFV